mgnify:FL=1
MTATDNVERHRFLYEVDGGTAQLVYRVEGDTLVLVHTEVPDEFGGRGIGGKLVAAAVERARRTGETIRPECPYARAWLAKHPDEVEGITVDLSGLAD